MNSEEQPYQEAHPNTLAGAAENYNLPTSSELSGEERIGRDERPIDLGLSLGRAIVRAYRSRQQQHR